MQATKGKDGFYKGRIANAIVVSLKAMGGVMTADDIATHVTTFEDPICVDYRGHQIYEIAPNGKCSARVLLMRSPRTVSATPVSSL
jgi:gamma-glutamyltranspeptidase/glutathione hydrolase